MPYWFLETIAVGTLRARPRYRARSRRTGGWLDDAANRALIHSLIRPVVLHDVVADRVPAQRTFLNSPFWRTG